MSESRPNYSDIVGSWALERATRLVKAIEADPLTPPGERDWTVDDVLAVAIMRGLDRLEEIYIDPRPIEAIRAQAAGDAAQPVMNVTPCQHGNLACPLCDAITADAH